MGNFILTGFKITPPPGLTPGGRVHQFQQRTVDRLETMTDSFMQQVVSDMRQRMAAAYTSPDATGRAARSLRPVVKADRRSGVSGQVIAGSFKEMAVITNLGGGRFHGGPYSILPSVKKYLKYFTKRYGVWVKSKGVIHPGFERDVLSEAANEWGQRFRLAAMNELSYGIAELTSGSKAKATTPAVSRHIRRRG